MLTISAILIGTTLVIIAWQDGWGTFKIEKKTPSSTSNGGGGSVRASLRPISSARSSNRVSQRPVVSGEPMKSCNQGINPLTSASTRCCSPEQACTWKTLEQAKTDPPLFPDHPGTANYGISAEVCTEYEGKGYYDGCWEENAFYPTNYPQGNLL